jgi:O-methyltransferase
MIDGAFMDPRAVIDTIDNVSRFTMVCRENLLELARHVQAVIALGIKGDFVECGTWRGGAGFLMADLLRQGGVTDRKVWLFDSFEGLPPPQPIDGPIANAWARATHSESYRDNGRVSLDEVKQSAAELELTPYLEFVEGWFDKTLPAVRTRVGPIAILRIDADWHASIRCCLDNLYDQVVDDGFIILDDYFAYDGCAIAVHEFLGERRLAHRIETVVGESNGTGALFRKGSTTWRQTWTREVPWIEQRILLAREIERLIPAGESLILVDQEQFGASIVAGRRVIPFLEKDGNYWGPPADDEQAVRELERLRQAGARYIIFAGNVSWWLEYYSGLREYLRSNFRLIGDDARMIAFDLRNGAAPSAATDTSAG